MRWDHQAAPSCPTCDQVAGKSIAAGPVVPGDLQQATWVGRYFLRRPSMTQVVGWCCRATIEPAMKF